MSMVTYPYSHGVDRKAPRGTYVVRRVATLELEHGTAKRKQVSTLQGRQRPTGASNAAQGISTTAIFTFDSEQTADKPAIA